MTVLVTGGAGYIGSHMVRALVDAGESVIVIDNLSTGFSAFLPEGVPLFIGDAGDENLVEGVTAQHQVESIIHFAGSVVVPVDALVHDESKVWPALSVAAKYRFPSIAVRSYGSGGLAGGLLGSPIGTICAVLCGVSFVALGVLPGSPGPNRYGPPALWQ